VNPTTRYRADWVLPVSAPPIRDGAVLVDDYGVIQSVGPDAAVPRPDAAEQVDLGAAIILPGLVNVHTHPELAGMRGLLEDLPFHRWIPTLRSAKEAASLSADDFGDSARWACLEAVAAGITAIGATEDSGAALNAMRETGLRGTVYREVFGPAPDQAPAAMARLRERVDAMRRRTTDLVGIGISPHAPYTVSDELFDLAARYARDEGLPVAVHAAEAEVEAQLVTAGAGPFAAGLRTRGIPTPRRGRSTIHLLHRTGLLATRPLLIHCVFVDADDMHLMADAGAAVAHCPIANARLGQGIAPVVEMLEAGIQVGLGTDSVASGNRVDILEEGRSAQLMQRARLASASALPPDRLLRLATIDGARALGLDRRVGTLEVGKDADLCAVRVDRLHARPVIDPIATLFMSARGSDVVLTVVRGKVLYRNGAFPTLHSSSMRSRIDAIGERLRDARDAGTASRPTGGEGP
jgi:cytosine/adenosine deaminase-related metal-dependent hydrolase